MSSPEFRAANPPKVDVTLNNQIDNKLTIYIDGQQIVGRVVAEVQSKIMQGAEFRKTPATFDTHASFANSGAEFG